MRSSTFDAAAGGARYLAVGRIMLLTSHAAGRVPPSFTERYLVNVGTGFTEAALRDLLVRLAPLHTSRSPFDDEVPRELTRGVTWVAPQLVGEVVYRTLTGDQRLRHAAWRGLRPDRDPDEVVIDLP